MNKKRVIPNIYFGWWTAIAGGLVSLWAAGYQIYGISALFKPISMELGFNRTATSVAASIGRLEGGFEAPLTGWVFDSTGSYMNAITTFAVLLVISGIMACFMFPPKTPSKITSIHKIV